MSLRNVVVILSDIFCVLPRDAGKESIAKSTKSQTYEGGLGSRKLSRGKVGFQKLRAVITLKSIFKYDYGLPNFSFYTLAVLRQSMHNLPTFASSLIKTVCWKSGVKVRLKNYKYNQLTEWIGNQRTVANAQCLRAVAWKRTSKIDK